MSDFKEILVLARGRSGTNLLCSTLGTLEGNAGFFEVFRTERAEGLNRFPALLVRLAERLDLPEVSVEAQDLLAIRDSNPASFLDVLSSAAEDEGYSSISLKVFPKQLSIAQLDQLLLRSRLHVLFLTRSRVHRHISGEKGFLTKQYVKTKTTDLKPPLRLEWFLKDAFKADTDLEDMYHSVFSAGVPYAFLNYERDIDIDPDLRTERIRSALEHVGFIAPALSPKDENWLIKQDQNANWRDKIENGFEISAALAGLGLLDYAEEAPLINRMRGTSVLPSTSMAHAPARAVPVEAPDEDLLDRYSNFAVISGDPIITFSSIDNDRSYLAEWMNAAEPTFGNRPGIHFLRPTWSMETTPLDKLMGTLRKAERCNPGHEFVLLHVSDREGQRYREYGRVSVPCNPSIFTDEANFSTDAELHPKLGKTDAFYLARFEPWKNHHLAAGLQNPLFVFTEPKSESSKACMTEVMTLCPSAQFANHLIGDGKYGYLDRAKLNSVMSQARVALALSSVEGFMRASTECLMAGLPVVSVPSVGGRDRLYTFDTAVIVEPTADAVKTGVSRLLDRKLSRAEVRRAVLSIIENDRRSFCEGINQLIANRFGPMAPAVQVKPLLDFTIRYSTLRKSIEALA